MRSVITALALLIVPASEPGDPAPDGCCREGVGCAMGEGVRCGPQQPGGAGHRGRGRGMAGGAHGGPQGRGGAGQRGGGMGMSADEHGAIFDLLSRHEAITRTVEEIPGGVRTVTTASDPELVATLRTHVRQMDRRLEQGSPVRMWDPVFREVFAHADEIELAMTDIDGGIEVTETSANPEVVPLIRAHAAKVNSFVAEGHAAARPPWAGGGRGRMRHGQ